MNRLIFFDRIRASLFPGGLSADQVRGINAILDQWDARRHADLRWLAYMLATTKWETAHTMMPIVEHGKRAYFDRYEGRRDLGNTMPGDGFAYRGRGYVQLTGRRNYAKAGDELGVNLVANPDRALDPVIAAQIMFHGMIKGWFTGKKLADYFNAKTTDWHNARRIINGTDRAAEIASLAKRFHDAISAAVTADDARAEPSTPARRDTGPAAIGVGGVGTVAVVAATAGVPWYLILGGLVAAGAAAFGIWWWLNRRG